MYRVTTRQQQRYAAMRQAKAAKRLDSDPRPPAPEIPKLRRRIVIVDYDLGQRTVHRLDLYRSDRVDCYDVIADGKPWRRRVGWSRILAGLRKSMPRLLSTSSAETP